MSGLWVEAERQMASVNLERARSLEVAPPRYFAVEEDPSIESMLIATFDGGTWYCLTEGSQEHCIAERERLTGLLKELP